MRTHYCEYLESSKLDLDHVGDLALLIEAFVHFQLLPHFVLDL